MKHRALIVVALLWTTTIIRSTVHVETTAAAASLPVEGKTFMSQESMIDLFNRWEQVWHEGKFDLVPSCVTGTYTRHDQKGIARYPAKHTQRKSPRCVSNALVSELLYTITPSRATVLGFVLPSSGQMRRPERRKPRLVYSFIELRMASSRKRGLRCRR